MIKNGFYLVNMNTFEMWEVEYDRANYTTEDTPTVRKSKQKYSDALYHKWKVKTFEEVVSLIPYPQLP